MFISIKTENFNFPLNHSNHLQLTQKVVPQSCNIFVKLILKAHISLQRNCKSSHDLPPVIHELSLNMAIKGASLVHSVQLTRKNKMICNWLEKQ